MLLVEDSSVLQARCHCTSGVGVWKDVEWAIYRVSNGCSVDRYNRTR